MSLIFGIPFSGGFVVAGDSASALAPGQTGRAVSKLHHAGGVLFSVSGITQIVEGARDVWSLAAEVTAAAGAALSPRDIPQVARSVARSLQACAAHTYSGFAPEEDGSIVFVWYQGAVQGFMLKVDGPRVALNLFAGYTVDPSARVVPVIHGYRAEPLIDKGALAKSSYTIMAKQIRHVTEAEARELALDIQVTTARHAPGIVGGPVDVEIVRAPARSLALVPSP